MLLLTFSERNPVDEWQRPYTRHQRRFRYNLFLIAQKQRIGWLPNAHRWHEEADNKADHAWDNDISQRFLLYSQKYVVYARPRAPQYPFLIDDKGTPTEKVLLGIIITKVDFPYGLIPRRLLWTGKDIQRQKLIIVDVPDRDFFLTSGYLKSESCSQGYLDVIFE